MLDMVNGKLNFRIDGVQIGFEYHLGLLKEGVLFPAVSFELNGQSVNLTHMNSII